LRICKTIIFNKIIVMLRSFSKWLMPICTLIILAISASSCSKGGGDTPAPPAPTEADLVVTTTPTVGSNQAPAALGTGLPVTVTISSTMPSGGVKIDVTAKLETGTSNFFTGGSAKSTTASNNFTVTSVPTGGQACVCSVTVTSLSKSTNIWTGTFRFASK
jgi:hypothetical protein